MTDAGRPLRVAALVKQVPVGEDLTLGPDGRLQRRGHALELNPYCRRAVAQGVALARQRGGTCTVFTLGPPEAEDALREALAWGADDAVHCCHPDFAGSDTLATARVLSAALARRGPFDLVLAGRNSVDGDTGQVGPEVAELLDLPFAFGVRRLELAGDRLRLLLELDDGTEEIEVACPALLSVAERLCEPAKVDPEGRAAVAADRITVLGPDELGPGPFGQAGSPTQVGAVRLHVHERERRRLDGPVDRQVAEAVDLLAARGALTPGGRPEDGAEDLVEEGVRSLSSGLAEPIGPGDHPPVVAVVLEPDRASVGPELLGTAAGLAAEVGGRVVALRPEAATAGDLGPYGADEVLDLVGEPAAEDVARTVTDWLRRAAPWAVLAPSTAFGREVAARCAAALGAGLVGDAVALAVVDGVLVAAKPAFAGALVADVTVSSPLQLVTVRPGQLPVPPPRRRRAEVGQLTLERRGRIRRLARTRDDDLEVLARAEVVVGVGAGVAPDEYERLSPLTAVLGAELAATRKVTDKGWAPRARQVGLTGRAIAPRLYVGVGVQGKFNHMVGVRSAGTVLAVNRDPDAPVFDHADIGIVGDWHEVVPALTEAIRRRLSDPGAVPESAGVPAT